MSDDYNTADVPAEGAITLTLSALLESLLFVADGPVPLSQFATALDSTPRIIEAALNELESQYQHRGLRIQRDKSGVQLTTAPQTAEAVEKFLGLDSTQRLSRPAVETLAIIAYQQPITRPRIEAIRGVNSDGVIKSLLTKGLIEEVGRTEGPGRPVLYSSTPAFLQHFGLSSVNELPPLDIEVLLAAAKVLGPENDPALPAPATEPAPAPETAEAAADEATIEAPQSAELVVIIEEVVESGELAQPQSDTEPVVEPISELQEVAKTEVEIAQPTEPAVEIEPVDDETALPDASAGAMQAVTEPPVDPGPPAVFTPAVTADDVLTAITDPALASDDVASPTGADPTPFTPLETDTSALNHLENKSMLNTPELLLEDTIADFAVATGPDGALIAPVSRAGDDDDDEEEEEDDDWVTDDVDDEDEEEEEEDEIDELDPDLEEVEEEEEVEEDEEAAVILEDEEETSLEEIEEEEDEDEDDWEDDDDEDLELDDDDDDEEEEEEEED